MGTLSGWSPQHRSRVEIRWRDGTITDVIRSGPRSDRPPADQQIILAGLVDLQVNGFRGHDVNEPAVAPHDIAAITEDLAAVGVTTWVPTVVTATEQFIDHVLTQVERARAADPRIARAIPMVHLEGPFISEREGPRGVHDPAQIRPLDADEVARWRAAHPIVGMITVSPHGEDAPSHIRRIVDLGIIVALGHTHATPSQLRAAVDAGATLATHLGNGIAPMLPRHPNPIWTLLADDRVTAGLIADGQHLPPEVLTVMLRAKPPGRAFIVSDATALAGMPPGRYRTAVGGDVEATPDGRLCYAGTGLLAGASRHLADGVRHLARDLGVPWPHVARLAAATPGAVVAHRKPGCGRLAPGTPADVVLMATDGTVLEVLRGGVMVGAVTTILPPPAPPATRPSPTRPSS